MKGIILGFGMLSGLVFTSAAFAGPCDYLGTVNGSNVELIEGGMSRESFCMDEIAIEVETSAGPRVICLEDIDRKVPPIRATVKEYLGAVLDYWAKKDPTSKFSASVCGYYEYNSHNLPLKAIFVDWTRFTE